ncbi:MAG: type IV secretion system protein [Gammaproteobacteria bacterium]|nr:type IV secretion system protein [Gammaproteobacteria bacterium]
MDALTRAAQSYMNTFGSYINQFLQWGQWLFFSLLIINIAWITLWYAFDRHSFSDSMPSFIKKFFTISFFYTIMLHPTWLTDILKTFQAMGNTLTHTPIDPSSLISQGIGIANKIILPIEKSSLLTAGFGLIIVAIVYVLVIFVFISIALDLALTLIITTALIAVASFFLGFAALGATSQIARQTLDVILANCVKLLGIYLVVAAGSQTMIAVSNEIPIGLINFDAYTWIVAVALLFWLVAKNLPNQLARIVSGSVQEWRGVDAAALSLSALNVSRTAMPAVKLASSAMTGIAKIAGSIISHAGANFNTMPSQTMNSTTGATTNPVSDHFKQMANKMGNSARETHDQ